jgi:CDP-diacylglycerol--serine O-phosphatidyltransferase
MKQLPNISTLANLFCGCMALVFILQAPDFTAIYGGQTYLVTAPEPLVWGSVLIALAAVFDFMDGLAARILHVKSPLGKDLDSLSDVVSFGVAPGMILFQLLKFSWLSQPGAINTSIIWLLPALLVPCFCALRLARFNQQPPSDYFTGVPAPAAGLLVASLPLILWKDSLHLTALLTNTWVLYGIIALDCYLMVSRLRMLSLKFKSASLTGNLPRYLLIAATLAGIFCIGYATAPAVFILYIILSLAFKPLAT